MKIHGTVTDATEEKPLAQAKVVLYVGETELATLHTSKDGTFELEQDLDQHVGEDLICKATKAQFKLGETAYKIGTDDIGINIELEAIKPLKTEPLIPTPPPDKPKSNKNIIIIGGAVCAALLVAIVIYFITRPKPVKIVSFKATPATIDKGDSVTLTWEIQNAKNASISEIGKVKITSGSREEKPQKTTTYILSAAGEKDRQEKTITVEVNIPPVKIVSFKAEPSTVDKGKSSTLTWETENAEKVTIDEIGEVESSGSKKVRPQKTTSYTLTAKGEKDKLSETCRVEVSAPEVRTTAISEIICSCDIKLEQYVGNTLQHFNGRMIFRRQGKEIKSGRMMVSFQDTRINSKIVGGTLANNKFEIEYANRNQPNRVLTADGNVNFKQNNEFTITNGKYGERKLNWQAQCRSE